MGLFGKKEKGVSKNSEEYLLKEGLDDEIEKLQENFRMKQDEYKTKQDELDNILQRIQTVKEEYNVAINSIMEVKKELNQKIKLIFNLTIRAKISSSSRTSYFLDYFITTFTIFTISIKYI